MSNMFSYLKWVLNIQNKHISHEIERLNEQDNKRNDGANESFVVIDEIHGTMAEHNRKSFTEEYPTYVLPADMDIKYIEIKKEENTMSKITLSKTMATLLEAIAKEVK